MIGCLAFLKRQVCPDKALERRKHGIGIEGLVFSHDMTWDDDYSITGQLDKRLRGPVRRDQVIHWRKIF